MTRLRAFPFTSHFSNRADSSGAAEESVAEAVVAGLGSGGPGPGGGDDMMGGMMGGAMGGVLGGIMAALGTGVAMFAPPPTNAGGPGSAPYHSAFEGQGRKLGGR